MILKLLGILFLVNVLFSCSKDDKSLDRVKFIATYNSVDNCPSGASNSVIAISASSTSDNAVLISNLLGLMSGTGLPAATGSINGSNLVIPNQVLAFNGQTVTVSGNGILNGSILNLTITYSFGGATETCSHIATKS